MKIAALMEKYKSHLKAKGFSEKTVRTYTGYTRIFGEFLEKINITQVEGITRSAVSRYQTSLCTKNEYNRRMLSLRTQSSRIVAVMSFCKFLHRAATWRTTRLVM